MNRKELYNEIVSLGLQEETKNRYGKNYTQCTNSQLQTLVDEVKKDFETVPAQMHCNLIYNLIEVLERKKILLKSEIQEIFGV